MISYQLPGRRSHHLSALVVDFNGTLAFDGKLVPSVRSRITALAKVLQIYVVTGDTFGTAREALHGLDVKVIVLDSLRQASAKERFISRLSASKVCAIGNGNNDVAMLRRARLAIAVIGREGCAPHALANADIVVRDVTDALDLLLHTKRLTASLRS